MSQEGKTSSDWSSMVAYYLSIRPLMERYLSLGRKALIVTESRVAPMKSIVCLGVRIDFSKFTLTPREESN